MKSISTYISEALKINSKSRVIQTTEVNSINDLTQIIQEEIQKCKNNNNPKLDLSFIRFSNEFINSTNKHLWNLFNDYLYNVKDITVLDITGWNLENFEKIDGLFKNCNYLENIIGLETLDLSNIYSATELFSNCKSLNFSCVKNLNVKGIKRLHGAFQSNVMTNLDFLSNWDISECEDISGMFFSCKGLTNVDGIKNWNVSSLRNNYNLPALNGLNNLFMYCTALTNIDLSNWTLGKDIIWVNYVFSDCYNLKTVKMFNVTETIKKARSLFEDCRELESIENIENWNISNNADCESMFYKCEKLSIDLRHWNLKATGSQKIKTGANKVKI
jgi:surface protein